ncbi:tetra-peptide repeat homeobox protein 1 [Fopius arisanus]|uniref:Tetra-peptide repeat homeobox protein 1 n=1 Tax=Fopius arisanus TaxID=64838 RepID=A0A0C9RQA9_9HYME|nr:PREDICTED: tetra-peptide repeat homeobox protein 1-like [Fopius arisanus]
MNIRAIDQRLNSNSSEKSLDMKGLLVLSFIFMGSALSLDPRDFKFKRSVFSLAPGWNSLPTPPDFDTLTAWPAETTWKTIRSPPETVQTLQPAPGWASLGGPQSSPPLVISKHTVIEKPVAVPRAVIVERRIPIQVEKLIPYPVDRVVNKAVPIAVPHPVPYPVDRPVQVPVRQTVAVPVQQPYPVPVAVRQGVLYPVPVPVILTPNGLLPASSISLPAPQAPQNGLSLPLQVLSPLAINAALSQGAQVSPPEGLLEIRDPGLAPIIEDNLLPRAQPQADIFAWNAPSPALLSDPLAQSPLLKWKRSHEENKEEKKSPK